MFPSFEDIANAQAPSRASHDLGRSREGRSIEGYRFGHGDLRVSLIAGCHADEPVGPAFLRRLVGYLASLDAGDPLLTRCDWWIVPHINPDGAARNAVWSDDSGSAFDLERYLDGVVREVPGDDIEFGFPRGAFDDGARPENRAVYEWWRSDERPFALHATLHGMAFAGGPWWLIEPTWSDRSEPLQTACVEVVTVLGYRLHDVDRDGEKGFVRIARGFATRPNSVAMAQFFEQRGDMATAALFRPSSMESVRSFGGDPLTLVSEVPLFVVPGIGNDIYPRDEVALRWRDALQTRQQGNGAALDAFAVTPVPIEHQMRLQWAFVRAGLELVATHA